jgi:hypothetical protein
MKKVEPFGSLRRCYKVMAPAFPGSIDPTPRIVRGAVECFVGLDVSVTMTSICIMSARIDCLRK